MNQWIPLRTQAEETSLRKQHKEIKNGKYEYDVRREREKERGQI